MKRPSSGARKGAALSGDATGDMPALTEAPRFGADTIQVLLEQGFSRREVDRLIQVRAVCQS